MVFSSLAGRLQEVLRQLRGRGRLTEKDVDEALREVKLALLEADVNFKVVRSFINRVRERAVGEEVSSSLTPGQMVVKIVHQELTALMGAKEEDPGGSATAHRSYNGGLQGSGRQTTTAKLGRHLKMQGRRPMLVAADIYRPAAVRQLRSSAKNWNSGLFQRREGPGGDCPGSTGRRRRSKTATIFC